MTPARNLTPHRFLSQILAHLLLLSLLLLAACGRDKGAEATATVPAPVAAAATTAPTSTSLPPEATALPAPQAVDPGSDPQQAVLNAIHAQLSGGPYRADTSIDAGGTITEMKTEVIPPDTMHIVIGGGNLELILVDGVLWSKSNGASWTKMGSPEMMQSVFDSIQGQMDASTLTNVQYAGAEPVLGEQTYIYTFTSNIGEGTDSATSDVKLWVSQTTGLPVRMESTGIAMGVNTHTLQSIEYDNTITVTAPTP